MTTNKIMMKADALITGHSRDNTLTKVAVASLPRVSLSSRVKRKTRKNRKSIMWCSRPSKKKGKMASRSIKVDTVVACLILPATGLLKPGSSTQEYMRIMYSIVNIPTMTASSMTNWIFSM